MYVAILAKEISLFDISITVEPPPKGHPRCEDTSLYIKAKAVARPPRQRKGSTIRLRAEVPILMQ